MGIDFIVDQRCPVKEVVDSDELIQLIKRRDRAILVMGKALADNPSIKPDEVTFVQLMITPEGRKEETVKATDLLKGTEVLDQQQSHCKGCPANLTGHPFGCYGYISYPIRPSTEEWMMMTLLPQNITTPAGFVLKAAVPHHGWDGAPAAQLREQGKTFFESDRPVGCVWGEGDTAFRLSSNQLFHMLFCLGDIQPGHALIMSYILGVIPHEISEEDYRRAIRDVAHRESLMARSKTTIPDGDPQIASMAQFLEALKVSARLELQIRISC